MGLFQTTTELDGNDQLRGRRAAERQLAGELLSAFRQQAQTTTEFMARLGGQMVNSVLEVWSGTFDSSGQLTRDYNVAAGSIEVENLGVAGHTVTVSSAAPGPVAPSGTGVYYVPGASHRTVGLGSRTVTLYGTPGDPVSFQVLAAGPKPTVN